MLPNLHNVGVSYPSQKADLKWDVPHLLIVHPAVSENTALAEEFHHHLGEGGREGGRERKARNEEYNM